MRNALTEKIKLLLKEKDRVIAAIDGPCASGKTTLGEYLSGEFDCNLFHMDDFFLRAFQRTEDRYNKIGGNVDYERFFEEVILPLLSGESFSYRPYDCHSGEFKNAVRVTPKKLNIIEGSYSLHEKWREAVDLSVLLTVGEEEQKARLMKRNPEMYEKFLSTWVPLENTYLKDLAEKYNIDEVI